MTEAKTDNPDPNQEKRSLRNSRVAITLAAAAMAMTGVAGFNAMHKESAPPHKSEAEITEASHAYQGELVTYAKELMNRIPEGTQPVSLQPEKGTEDAAYELTNVSPIGQDGERTSTTMVLHISSGENQPTIASMDITGTKETSGAAVESVETTIDIDTDSLQDGEGAFTRDDFVRALNGVELDDVRSIVAFSPGSPEIHGTFSTYKAPLFMDETNTHIAQNPPSAQEISRVINEVLS